MVGVTGALIGSAVIGAGASVVSGNKAAKAAAKGADQAAQIQKYQYDTTREDYAPYRQVGYGALEKLAGLSGVEYTNPSKVNWDAYVAGNPDAMANWNSLTAKQRQEFGSTQQFGQYHYEKDGSRRDLSKFMVGGAQAGGSSPNYSDFEKSPGYLFRLQQGQKAIERSAAARGGLYSGATMKALDTYSQGVASDEFGNYVNRLSALAGIGQSATGSTAAAGAQAAGGMASAAQNAGAARASSYVNAGNAINSAVGGMAGGLLYQQGFGGGGGVNPYGISGAGNIY